MYFFFQFIYIDDDGIYTYTYTPNKLVFLQFVSALKLLSDLTCVFRVLSFGFGFGFGFCSWCGEG